MIDAIINNETNIVENTIVYDPNSTWQPPEGYYIINIDGLSVGINWTYDPQTNSWTAPPEPEPEPAQPSLIGVTRV